MRRTPGGQARLVAGCPQLPTDYPATQTHQPTAHTKKTCKRRPFRKRLKGFEASTFCMASSSSVPNESRKCLQTADFEQPDGGLGFRKSRGDTGV